MSAANPQFEKFDELLVYIAEKSADDPQFGDLKLNKLLYYADITAYRRLGASITGTRYQHLDHGPGSVSLLRARKNLIQSGRLKRVRKKVYSFFRNVTEATGERPARRDVFDEGELEIVDEVLEKYAAYNGDQMADLSHREPGWNMTSDREDIPLETSLLLPRASDAAIKRGRQLARERGW